MTKSSNPAFSRNYGFWSREEQQALIGSDVAIAGVGGDGYLLGLSLVRMGVSSLRIADPETFEAENLNRVPGATNSRIGRAKVDCFVEDAMAINESLKLRVYPDGVTPENCQEFVESADLVIDESELTKPEIGTAIADTARRQQIPNLHVMNIGFAAQVTSFDPTSTHTFRTMMGIAESADLDEVELMDLDLPRVLPFLPPYLDMGVVEAVTAGAPLPSIVQGVNLAGALGTSQAFLHLTQNVDSSVRPDPVWYPNFLYIDSLTGDTKRTNNVEQSHSQSMQVLSENNRTRNVTPLVYPLDAN